MPTLDIFKGDGFSMTELTIAINEAPFKPGRLGDLGIFEDDYQTQTSVQVESDGKTLALLPTKTRGEPPSLAKSTKRKLRSFIVPHIPHDDVIRPDEIQGVRAFGTEGELETVAGVIQRKLDNARQKHEATLEHLRVGAIKGTILDSDGTTAIYNLFTEFGITQPTVTFALGTTTTDPNDAILDALNAIEDAAGQTQYDYVHAFCGRAFFKKFTNHPMVKDAYRQFQAGLRFQKDTRYAGFEYGGIVWEQYRGRIGTYAYIPDTDVQFVPVGAAGLFKTVFAPANMMSAANTVALAYYARQEELPRDAGVALQTESNPLTMCTKPGVLVKGTSSN